jgi:hypothetical protein
LISDLSQAPGETQQRTRHPELDAKSNAVLEWLLDVCSRSERSQDQVFIWRDLSRFVKPFRRDRRGEIKAIGMSDLRQVHRDQYRELLKAGLLTPRKGHWPGRWFSVNFEAVG